MNPIVAKRAENHDITYLIFIIRLCKISFFEVNPIKIG